MRSRRESLGTEACGDPHSYSAGMRSWQGETSEQVWDLGGSGVFWCFCKADTQGKDRLSRMWGEILFLRTVCLSFSLLYCLQEVVCLAHRRHWKKYLVSEHLRHKAGTQFLNVEPVVWTGPWVGLTWCWVTWTLAEVVACRWWSKAQVEEIRRVNRRQVVPCSFLDSFTLLLGLHFWSNTLS